MSPIVFYLLLSGSRWFPSSLLCRLAIFCLVVLLISSLSLVATLCSVWSTYCPSFVILLCPAHLYFCFSVYPMSIIRLASTERESTRPRNVHSSIAYSKAFLIELFSHTTFDTGKLCSGREDYNRLSFGRLYAVCRR